jgi:hypothetical protein
LGALDKLNDHLVIDVIALPSIPAWHICIVLIHQYFLLDVVDIQLVGHPIIKLISLKLVHDDLGP